MGKQSQY
jgi:hypothetical protein